MKTLYSILVLASCCMPAIADLQANALPRPISSEEISQFRTEMGLHPAGDANYDDTVNIIDLILIRNKLYSSEISGDYWLADVNHDNTVNILDLIYTRNRLNKTSPFLYFSDGASPISQLNLNPGDIVPIFVNIDQANSVSFYDLQLSINGPARTVGELHHGHWFSDFGDIDDVALTGDRASGYLSDAVASGSGDLAWFEIEYLGGDTATISFDGSLFPSQNGQPYDMESAYPLVINALPVPLPSSLGLLAAGSAGLLAIRVRRKKNKTK